MLQGWTFFHSKMCIIRGCIFFFFFLIFMSNLRRFQRVTRMWATSWGWPCLTELTSTSLEERGRVDLRRWKAAGSHLMRYHYPNRHPTEIRPDFPCCADMVWLDEYKLRFIPIRAQTESQLQKKPLLNVNHLKGVPSSSLSDYAWFLRLSHSQILIHIHILWYKLSCQNSHFFLKKWLNRHVRPNVVSH